MCNVPFFMSPEGVILNHFFDDRYGEGLIANLFSDQWRGIQFTRVEANHGAVYPGGMADSNNSLEATNHAQKMWSDHKRMSGEAYVGELAKYVGSIDVGIYFPP